MRIGWKRKRGKEAVVDVDVRMVVIGRVHVNSLMLSVR